MIYIYYLVKYLESIPYFKQFWFRSEVLEPAFFDRPLKKSTCSEKGFPRS